MGVVNVTPDSLLRRWPLPRSRRRRRPRPPAGRRRRRRHRRGRRVDPARRRAGRPGRRAAPRPAGDPGAGPHVRVSVDTRHARRPTPPIEAGATLVNDVSASLARWPPTPGVGWVAMHMQGDPRTMQDRPELRRRGRRGPRLPRRARRARPSPPASTRSGSTRASASARRSPTTWPCSPTSTPSSPPATRCVVGTVAARGSSGGCWRPPTPRRGTAAARPDDPPRRGSSRPAGDRLEGSIAARCGRWSGAHDGAGPRRRRPTVAAARRHAAEEEPW